MPATNDRTQQQALQRIDQLNDVWNAVNDAINKLDAIGDAADLAGSLRNVRDCIDRRIDALCVQPASETPSCT